MDDAQIIEIFFRRDPAAIDAVQQRYGKRCLAAACHILPDSRDAEECVALDKCDYNKAAQRRSDLTLAFDELEGCLSGPDEAQAAVERQDFGRVLNDFLRTLTRQSRTFFVRRYWYGESIREIAESCGAGEERIKSSLFRTRQRLRKTLEKEGML